MWSTFIFKEKVKKKKIIPNNLLWSNRLIGGGKAKCLHTQELSTHSSYIGWEFYPKGLPWMGIGPKCLHTQELSTLPLQINENFTRKAYLHHSNCCPPNVVPWGKQFHSRMKEYCYWNNYHPSKAPSTCSTKRIFQNLWFRFRCFNLCVHNYIFPQKNIKWFLTQMM